ncbi:MAG: BlaI/MecI/CopY family transcriptional regulator [Planctomycetota bacterium]
MTDRPALSKAETEVARVLWGLGEASARQVCEAMPTDQKRDFSTIQTYLSRLASKGYLTAELKGRTKFFSPAVKRSQVVRETVDEFVNRLFGGQALPLLRHLISERPVTPEELAELRNLIDRLEGESADHEEAP